MLPRDRNLVRGDIDTMQHACKIKLCFTALSEPSYQEYTILTITCSVTNEHIGNGYVQRRGFNLANKQNHQQDKER